MSRHFPDWLKAYVDYAGFSEAPKRMHFWAGVSALAGALRRRVWIDMKYFQWHVNHYIVFVAPPGVVSKSSTVAIAMNILRKVPGINFGPDVVSWPALVTAFASCTESFEMGGDYYPMCAITLESSEFGNLVNPQDRDMIDLLVCLWDSKQGSFKKATKTAGNDLVENPWINLIACTTPGWIAGNFPESVIGGGFTSRCVFVYAEIKEKLVAYPAQEIPKDFMIQQNLLAADLTHIATELCGPYVLSDSAIKWGTLWYEAHNTTPPETIKNDDRLGGYLARKQTHIHKLAMVLAASARDELVILEEDLKTAALMVNDLEKDMPKVFDKIGRTTESIQAERFIKFVQDQPGPIPYAVAYQFAHKHFPDLQDFEGIVKGAVSSGQLELIPRSDGVFLRGISVRPKE